MAFLKPVSQLLRLTTKINSEHVKAIRILGVYHQLGYCTVTGEKLQEKDAIFSPVYRIAVQHAGRVAIKDGFGLHSYDELLLKSLKLAKKIRSKIGGNKTQERIAFLCPNDSTYVLAQWACWAAGHIAVPLSPIHPPGLLSYYLQDSQASLAITCTDQVELLQSVTENLNPRIPLMVLDDSWSQSAFIVAGKLKEKEIGKECSSVRIETDTFEIDPQLNSLLTDFAMPPEFYQNANAMILYTSGTTGKPKGVLLSHGNIDAQVRSLLRAWAWSPADVIVHSLPLHHTHGIVNALLCPLYVGARCIMLPKFDASNVWSKLLGVNMSATERPSIFMGVPTMYSKLLDEYEKKLANNPKLKEYVKSICSTKVRLMVSGSAPLPESIFQKWFNITGHYLLERYGMTEIGMALSNPLKGERRPGHVGLPLPDVRVRIVQFKKLSNEKNHYDIFAEGNFRATKVEPGQAGLSGELIVKGPNVFQGYWNKPEETDKSFTKDGWFRTGDVAQYTNGYYKVLGRLSTDIIKSGGYKISALQIETRLLSHPKVVDCAVLGLPDETWGEKVVVAVCMKDTKDRSRIEELKTWCKDGLAPYMVPTEWRFVDQLTRNAMGKVNKVELAREIFKK